MSAFFLPDLGASHVVSSITQEGAWIDFNRRPRDLWTAAPSTIQKDEDSQNAAFNDTFPKCVTCWCDGEKRWQLYLSACCVQSPHGTARQGRAFRSCSRRIAVCSPRTSSPTGSASSGTPAMATPAAQSPCSTGRYLRVQGQEKERARTVQGRSHLECVSFRNIFITLLRRYSQTVLC